MRRHHASALAPVLEAETQYFALKLLFAITTCAAKSRALKPTCSRAPSRGWRSSSAPTEAGRKMAHPRTGSSRQALACPAPSSYTPITDAKFASAIATCLSTNPVDGMFSTSEFGAMPGWDTSRFTDMKEAFKDKSKFNADISKWNTSGVTSMYGIFRDASAFDQPLGTWNTASVTTMRYMFVYASAFDQPLGAWNTASVTNMHRMFSRASSFDQPLAAWSTASVTDMKWMFFGAAAFDQDITGWSTPALTAGRCKLTPY